ncbi:general substrate transporter [Myriangium duriaei CBS 260.36]|uniref:General substrate transporter n=1 Tax=Myriangium duriaei CBS 260.36 TaxID=1168546 RepID=A0A9P4J8U8_9PEZI|nr:general substrate transporter [Myriangium duriaei CBS 260.36]
MDSPKEQPLPAWTQEQPKPTLEYIENVKSKEERAFAEDIIEHQDTGRFVWIFTLTVSLGGFLFGYDTGVISAVLVNLGTDLGHNLSSNEKELITSLTSGGALFGALFAGFTADKYGRKLGIYVGCFVFVVGAVIQAASYSLAQMSVGRFVIGLGVGSAAMIVPLYIGELAPAKYRGTMIAFDNMSVTFGQLVSYALGAGLTYVPHGWRYMIAIGGIPALFLAGCLHFCPESPRQLIAHGKLDDARKVLKQVWPTATEEMVDQKLNLIKTDVEQCASCVSDKSLGWQMKQLFLKGVNRRPLICACVVMAISQFSGFNTLMYYSSTLFGLVGFKNATVVSIVVGATNFIFSVVNMVIVDRAGRRKILLWTLVGMAISLAIVAVAFHFIPIDKDLNVTSTTVNWAGILILVMIIVFIAFYSGGCATIAWIGTELLPIEVRSLGTMLNTATCWGSNIVVASTFLSMMKGMTPSGAFGFYAGLMALGEVFVIFCYPEVNGLPLETVREVYADGYGVKFANQLQKDRKLYNRSRD